MAANGGCGATARHDAEGLRLGTRCPRIVKTGQMEAGHCETEVTHGTSLRDAHIVANLYFD